jgi:hypothetical protein
MQQLVATESCEFLARIPGPNACDVLWRVSAPDHSFGTRSQAVGSALLNDWALQAEATSNLLRTPFSLKIEVHVRIKEVWVFLARGGFGERALGVA